jgi:tripeptidyl-peptidase I
MFFIDIESVENLLDTEYSVFEHEDGSRLLRTSEWSVPLHLHEKIDTIQPTNSFMRTSPQTMDWKQFITPWTPPGYMPPSNETISEVCQFFPVTIE